MDLYLDYHHIFDHITFSGCIAYHITCVMHNTRTSKRMSDYGIKKGIGEYLTISEEEHLLKIICKHIAENQLKILAINLCADHLHFALVCNSNQLEQIVGKLKSMVAREFNIWRGATQTRGHAPLRDGHAPLRNEPTPVRGTTQHSLWAQKFNRVKITSAQQLYNVINYVFNNRIKHGLQPFNSEMEKIIQQTLFRVQ